MLHNIILLAHLTWWLHVHTDSNTVNASLRIVEQAMITPCQGRINLLCRVLKSLVVARDILPIAAFAAFARPLLPSDFS